MDPRRVSWLQSPVNVLGQILPSALQAEIAHTRRPIEAQSRLASVKPAINITGQKFWKIGRKRKLNGWSRVVKISRSSNRIKGRVARNQRYRGDAQETGDGGDAIAVVALVVPISQRIRRYPTHSIELR